MKLQFRFVFFSLSILPAYSGDDVISSSKGGLVPDSAGRLFLEGSDRFLEGGDRFFEGSDRFLERSDRSCRALKAAMEPGVLVYLGVELARSNLIPGITSLVVPGVFGMNLFTAPAGIGPGTGAFNRAYDNGFVRPGPRTPATGRTTDYGFQNPGQSQGNNLIFTADGGERRVIMAPSTSSVTGWREGEDWEISPYLSLSRLSDLGNGWSVGPSFHFSFTNVDGDRSGLNTLNASERRDVFDVRATDRFDSTGLVLPNAPYTGSPGAVAPLLPAEPAGRTFEDTLRSSDTAAFNDSVNESLDVNLFGISLGGEAIYQTDGRFLQEWEQGSS